jgi:putative endonuclease
VNRRVGGRIERSVERYLLARGLRLVARNFDCRFGEIDLVMEDRGTLVFVEVRGRSSRSLCTAVESVGRIKQARLILAARHLIATRPHLAERAMRFDVVAISRGHGDNAVEWIRDAFRP